MLGSAKIGAFVPTRDAQKARRFYVDVLGLHFVSDDQFALVLDANGVKVRVQSSMACTYRRARAINSSISEIFRGSASVIHRVPS